MNSLMALFIFATVISWTFALILAKEFIEYMDTKYAWIFAVLSMVCAFMGGAIWLFYG